MDRLTFIRTRRLAVLLVTLAALLAPASPARGADPYFERLLGQGIAAFEVGDFAGAAGDLRVAAFGLLEEPPRRVEALARLALAQEALGEAEAAAETLRALVEAERLLGAYRAAALPPGLEERVETLLAATLAPAEIAGLAAFEGLTERRRAAEIDALPSQERRGALEALLAAEPASPLWNARMARLELDEERFESAHVHAERWHAGAPEDPAARCVRGAAAAGLGRCGEAVADLEDGACPAAGWLSVLDEDVVATWLGCLVEGGRPEEAAALLATVPEPMRRRKPLRRLAREVERGQRRAAAAAARAARDAEESGTQATSADATAPPPGNGAPGEAAGEDAVASAGTAARGTVSETLPPETRERMDEVRRRSAAGRSAGELAEPLAVAVEVAESHPASRDAQHLAAEVAYRASRWDDAVRFFRRGGLPDPGRPELAFYFAVALYETGEARAARQVLGQALPRIQRTPFVDEYVRKIQEAPEGSGP